MVQYFMTTHELLDSLSEMKRGKDANFLKDMKEGREHLWEMGRDVRPWADLAGKLFRRGFLHRHKIINVSGGRPAIEYCLTDAGIRRLEYLEEHGCTQKKCSNCGGKRFQKKSAD